MVPGQWKPQEYLTQNKSFYENQNISFMYNKKLCVGKIDKLLTNSVIVSLPIHKSSDIAEKTVINYKDLTVI